MQDQTQHPAFPQPNSLDASLWRYMDEDKFVRLLENSRLFMPVISKIGSDILEGTRPTGDKAWWDIQINNENDEKIKDIIKSNSEKMLNFSKMFRPYCFVQCWHIAEDENMEMWRQYTKGEHSLAVKTSYKILREVLPITTYLGVVRYINYKTEKLPSFNIFEYVMHKDASYSFENEARAVAAPLTEADLKRKEFDGHIFEMGGDTDFTVYAPKVCVITLIQRIVMHPNSPDKFTKKIECLCAEHGLPQPEKSLLEVA